MSDYMGPLGDWDLLEACKTGDNRAWNELFHRHQQELMRHLLHRLRGESDHVHLAEDIGQDVFLALYDPECHRLDYFNPQRGSFAAFLKAVAEQLILQRCRWNSSRKHREVSIDGNDPVAFHGNEALVQAEFAEYRETLTAQEKPCLDEDLMGEHKEHPEVPPLSAANWRQLKHRLLRKANKHFDLD